MAKLIVVTRDESKESLLKMDKLLAEIPQWEDQMKRFKMLTNLEKERRDSEFSAIRTDHANVSKEAR